MPEKQLFVNSRKTREITSLGLITKLLTGYLKVIYLEKSY